VYVFGVLSTKSFHSKSVYQQQTLLVVRGKPDWLSLSGNSPPEMIAIEHLDRHGDCHVGLYEHADSEYDHPQV